jgi:hypothetical protein
LQPSACDDFVRLFESDLLDPQDAAGMNVLGQFRDVDRPNMFIWIRAFVDMKSRYDALDAFYGGPVWAEHRDAANELMIDSDDVLLMEPGEPGFSLAEQVGERPAGLDGPKDASVFLGRISALSPDQTADYVRQSQDVLAPLIRQGGGRSLAPLVSLHYANTFTLLPVREGVNVVFTMAAVDDLSALTTMLANPTFENAQAELDAMVLGPVQVLRLRPTPRSALR